MPSNYQYMLVQCPCCKNWYIVRGIAGKRAVVSLDTLAEAESALSNECRSTHHKGRRKGWSK